MHLPKQSHAHWTRVQSAVIGSFTFWSKPKVKPALVVKLASEIADLATAEFQRRTGERK